MPEELRVAFHRNLDQIEEKVRQLLALVAEGAGAATDALLADDRETARGLRARDELIDSTYHDLEDLVQHQFALQSPMAGDLRFLLTVLRMIPELERSHDLAVHIARRAGRGVTSELSPRMRGLIEEMGRTVVEMWREAAAAFDRRDPDVAAELEERDDEIDDLHASLTAELGTGTLSVPVTMEMVLVARFFERLGDHAVNVARRVAYLARGVSA